MIARLLSVYIPIFSWYTFLYLMWDTELNAWSLKRFFYLPGTYHLHINYCNIYYLFLNLCFGMFFSIDQSSCPISPRLIFIVMGRGGEVEVVIFWCWNPLFKCVKNGGRVEKKFFFFNFFGFHKILQKTELNRSSNFLKVSVHFRK